MPDLAPLFFALAAGTMSASYAILIRYPATHGVLRGQRTTSSPLEFSAARRILGRSES